METVGFAAFFRDRARRRRRRRGDAAARRAVARRAVSACADVTACRRRRRRRRRSRRGDPARAPPGHDVERRTSATTSSAASSPSATRDGFTFDIGPSLVTLPHVFDELFRVAGTSLADEVAAGAGSTRSSATTGPTASRWSSRRRRRDGGAFERSPGRRCGVAAFDEHGRRIWDVSERTFLAGPMSGPAVAGAADALARATCWRSTRCARCTAAPPRTSHDPRLVQWAGRYATYSGSSPYRAPATLACIPHVEAAYGCWYPIGGLGALRAALERVAAARRRRGAHRQPTSSRIARPRRRGATASCSPTATVAAPTSSSPTSMPSTSTPTCSPTRGALRRVAPGASARRAGSSSLAARARPHAGHRPPQRVVLRRRPRPSSPRSTAGRHGRRPDDLRLRLVGHRPDAGAGGCENWFLLVNAPAGHRPRRATRERRLRARPAGRPRRRPARRGSRVRRRITPRDLARALPRRRAARSTARRRTGGGPRSCAPATGAPRARPVPRRRLEPPRRRAAARRRRAPASSPTWSPRDRDAAARRRAASVVGARRRRGVAAARCSPWPAPAPAAAGRRATGRRRRHDQRRRPGPRRGDADRAAARRRSSARRASPR